MSLKELGDILSEMYNNAPFGDQVAMIHLFGIKYSDQIIYGKYSKLEIAKAARIPDSYATEINKGVKLAKYVIPKS